mmetsp:Transcript_11191/g.45544  ORF Transcript_11191/g.45544 Transcript_11191/m.45544 type:complete len:864 (-) Transcript_11191:84-2675(-)|eukprot:CAMPEP_0114614408 /NCGR_PEP_ID=MMETSP0168-20121206/5639_1 /TAXON_ID=95228 ORGANISM="Vannella sp., Strain DIVA3 517/6/12" /NCGR_SAMPLE_ID=MMETSP0168 /ASSEMBLY_ACC=CAM_ASM_000044 /LENGTH=863 /DNA_ID=CAMNT_0001825457 /DNA_START=102 /DNA_END=2693 /DNA_ORIENTATION=+
MASEADPLPPKLDVHFRGAIKAYERKQYKKGIKLVNTILQQQEHGESLAIKGLLTNCMGKRDEAHALARKGLFKCLQSHICWHVYGLLHRSDRNYTEAIKCYRNAIKRNPSNMQILRDLAALQVQMRDLEGFLETRLEMVKIKHTLPTHWYALCVALHLVKEYDAAILVMSHWENSVPASQATEERPDLERNERKLYLIRLYELAGKYDDALRLLDENEAEIRDKTGARERKGEMLLKVGRNEEAEKVYTQLLELNIENHNYHAGLRQALGLPTENSGLAAEDVQKLDELYSKLLEQYPKSTALKHLPLCFLPAGERFNEKLRAYVIPALRKGVPSLFATLQPLYTDDKKAAAIGELVNECVALLKKEQKLPDSEVEEPPFTIIWLWYYLAKHYDMLGDTQKALDTIDEAIAHTPTIEELYMCKARIYKHAGATQKATVELEKARRLDLADRFINTKSTKYLMRSNAVERANKTIDQFTRDVDNGGKSNLHDMQCMWYEVERAEAHMRRQEPGLALKMIRCVDKHFEDITEDQFDFHSFCLRKVTLRAYTEMLEIEDRLYAHPKYVRAAKNEIKLRIMLHDNPPANDDEEEDPEKLFSGLTGKELKKAKSKWRKQQLVKEAEQQKKAAEAEKEKQKNGGKDVDEDPDGEKLVRVEDQLAEATRFLKMLEKHSPALIETHLLGFQVYFRKRRFLLALRALSAARAIDANHPQVLVDLVQLYTADRAGLPEMVATVLADAEKEMLGGKAVADYLKAAGQAQAGSLPHRVAQAEALLLLGDANRAEAEALVRDFSGDSVTIATCAAAAEVVKRCLGEEEHTRFVKAAHDRFPFAEAFSPSTALEDFLEENKDEDDLTQEAFAKRNR